MDVVLFVFMDKKGRLGSIHKHLLQPQARQSCAAVSKCAYDYICISVDHTKHRIFCLMKSIGPHLGSSL